MFNWDWQEFRKSLILCSPTQLVLTFADWLCPEDINKLSYASIGSEIRTFIQAIEITARDTLGKNIRVTVITTGAGEEHILDLKSETYA